MQYFDSFSVENDFYIVMEYCEAGSVADMMETCEITLTETQISCILVDTLRALSFLHSKKWIHRGRTFFFSRSQQALTTLESQISRRGTFSWTREEDASLVVNSCWYFRFCEMKRTADFGVSAQYSNSISKRKSVVGVSLSQHTPKMGCVLTQSFLSDSSLDGTGSDPRN